MKETASGALHAWRLRWDLTPGQLLEVAVELRDTVAFASVIGEGTHEARLNLPEGAKRELATIVQTFMPDPGDDPRP